MHRLFSPPSTLSLRLHRCVSLWRFVLSFPRWISQFLCFNMARHRDRCTPSVCATALQWRHNGRDSVSNHQPHHCLLNGLLRHRSKKTSKLRLTGLCAVNSPGTGEFPAQMASNAINVSIWWRHPGLFGVRCSDVAYAPQFVIKISLQVSNKFWYCFCIYSPPRDVSVYRHFLDNGSDLLPWASSILNWR